MPPKPPCLECGGEISSRKQNFCCDAHKRAWHNRNGGRGQMLTPLAMAWRASRDERDPLSAAAYDAFVTLLDEYIAQDRADGFDPSEGARRKLRASSGAPRIKDGV